MRENYLPFSTRQSASWTQIHHTRRHNFSTDLEILKVSFRSLPQDSATLNDESLFLNNLKPQTPKHMWNIKIKHFPHIPILTQWWKAAVIWFNQTTFKAGGSEHYLSQVCRLLLHTQQLYHHTGMVLLNGTWRTRKNSFKPFCGKNLIPTFLIKKHKTTSYWENVP